MASGRVNMGGGGGGINVFVQPTEPNNKKEGIWIKDGRPKSDIINDNVLWFAGEWANPTLKKYADVPYLAAYRTACQIGDDIYLGMGYYSATSKQYTDFYRYDTVNDTWTKLADCPITIGVNYKWGVLAPVGDTIYLICGNAKFFKYDIPTNTWITLPNTKIGSYVSASACTIGTDIYLIRTGTTNDSPYFVKYDTLTDQWITLPNGGYYNGASLITYGPKIFMVGGQNGYEQANTGIRLYDPETNKWGSWLSPCPTYGSVIYLDGNKIHLYAVNGHYVYNIDTNTWTAIAKDSEYVPFSTNGYTLMFNIGNYVVAMDNANASGNYRYNKTSKQFKEGTVIIYRVDPRIGLYFTELSSVPNGLFTGPKNRLTTAFDDVYLFADGDLQTNLETYYGDGTKWIKFKGY